MPRSFPPLLRTSEDALAILREGNLRFVAGRREHPHEFLTRAYETSQSGQNPVAVILSCSDSRVPLEIVFDQGLGDIFAIRVAGNVCGPSELASIEFALLTTETKLCVILGHTHCGAVSAACLEERYSDHVNCLVASIHQAVDRTIQKRGECSECADLQSSDFINACCVENVFLQMEMLFQHSSVVRDAVLAGELLVLGAIYDIENGQVTFLEV